MYCNYSKSKFGGELTFIIPNWLDIPEGKTSLRDTILEHSIEVSTYIDTDEHSPTELRQEPGLKSSRYYSDKESVSDDWSNKEWPFIKYLEHVEGCYFTMLNKGWSPQQARALLPNTLKTELVMTGFISDWLHFFDLRSNKYGRGGAHPQADELATPLYEEFVKRGYIKASV